MTRPLSGRHCNLIWWLCAIAIVSIGAAANADDYDYLPSDVTYDSAVPTPASELGYQPGTWHVRHDPLVSYMRVLADSSARVEISEIGKTYENRDLIQLTISSPQNLRRLENIKNVHRQLASPQSGDTSLADIPVMVSMNYSIHGNESSPANAALLVAYYLAAAQGNAVDELLDDVVVVLNPVLNPDGLSLFANWVNYHKSKNLVAHPMSREHTAIWPAGRMNHYLFNLNRDWLFVQQKETQAFVRQIRGWLPHIFADFHETGTDTTAYFQPGVPTRVHPFTSAENQALTEQLAKYSAAAYDEQGLLYYTKERFDDFYHGKSSTFGDVIGSIGLTFEVGSSRGHLKDSVNGPVSFPLTIKKQIIASLALLEGAQELRPELLAYQLEYFESARRDASRDSTKLYVIGDGGDPERLNELSRLLLRQGVDVYELAHNLESDGDEYQPGQAIVVPTNQQNYRIVKTLFERRTEFVEPVFYDVSAWNAPMAFNLPYAGVTRDRGLLGDQLELPITTASVSAVAESRTGYIFSWRDLNAPKALNLLLRNGVHARVATKPLTLETNKGVVAFARGSIVIPVQLQSSLDKPVVQVLRSVSTDTGIPVYSVATGLADSGIDLGSSSFKPIGRVRPMLLAGKGISRTEVGEVWYSLDQRIDMALPVVDIAHFDDVELTDFTHLIMVNGDYDKLTGQVARIRDWVRSGGTLILQRGAAVWAQDHAIGKSDDSSTGAIAATGPTLQDSILKDNDFTAHRRYENQELDSRSEKIAGAILHVEIDDSHPLGFGYDHDGVAVMRQGTHVFPSVESPYANPGRYSESPLLSGYVSDKNLERLSGTPAITVEKVGKGSIVSFADNSNFRAYFYGSSKLFLNALFFSNAVSYVE